MAKARTPQSWGAGGLVIVAVALIVAAGSRQALTARAERAGDFLRTPSRTLADAKLCRAHLGTRKLS